ncbi:MAG: DUF4976 domain-containing protein [Nitrospiraceae bacterium]|nr:MAG: DUF4976 domain-containing protein [Nitrospiraceae bacterium]
MTAKKSYLVILRIFFVVFSLMFIRDAFYKWDGYSFYMKFTDFLPDLSLVFIIWSIMGILLASVFWFAVYGITIIMPKPLKFIRFEHLIAGLLGCGFIYYIKTKFFHFSFQRLTGLDNFTTYTIIIVFTALVIWFFHKHIEKILHRLKISEYVERVLIGIAQRITPVASLFALLFIFAVLFTAFQKNTSEIKSESVQLSKIKTEDQFKKRPDIIMVVWDTLTAQDMSMYGYNRPTTPFLSEWSKDAIVFEKAYASCNWTYPSTMSLLTGQRPWTHRAWHYRPFYLRNKKYGRNLPSILKDNGYIIYGLVQNSIAHPAGLGMSDAFLVQDPSNTLSLPKNWWLDRTISHVKNDLARDWIINNEYISNVLRKYRPDTYTTIFPPDIVYNRFLKKISEINPKNHSRLPFFAYLHVLPPHHPYLPSNLQTGILGNHNEFNTKRKQSVEFELPEYIPERQKNIDILRERYDEFILYSDDLFKSFISSLSELIDISNTIIVFTSDHGEIFSHGYLGHSGPHLYEELVHIPLVIKTPGEKNGAVINVPVEQTDIAPTILELANIPVPSWMEGSSLFPLTNGETRQSLPVFSMQLISNPAIEYQQITKGTFAVWEGNYKLIHYLEDNKSLLFNLKTDPNETQNIFDEQPEIARRLKSLLDDKLALANKSIIQSSELSMK